MAAKVEVVNSLPPPPSSPLLPLILLPPPLLASLEGPKTSYEVPILIKFTIFLSVSPLEAFYLFFYLPTQCSWVSSLLPRIYRRVWFESKVEFFKPRSTLLLHILHYMLLPISSPLDTNAPECGLHVPASDSHSPAREGHDSPPCLSLPLL